MLKKVEVEITAKVRTTLDVHDDESLDDLQSRNVDIYIHGAGPDGYMNKQDVGANEWEIKVVENAQVTITRIIEGTAWILKKELPPIGTVCEYRWGPDKAVNWYKVEIILHDNGYAVFRSPEASYARHQSSCVPEDFRPLRTARELAIQEMSKVFHDASNGAVDDIAFGALYDAGYLKR